MDSISHLPTATEEFYASSGGDSLFERLTELCVKTLSVPSVWAK